MKKLEKIKMIQQKEFDEIFKDLNENKKDKTRKVKTADNLIRIQNHVKRNTHKNEITGIFSTLLISIATCS